MKKVKLITAGLLIAGVAAIYSCKKTTDTPVDDAASQQATAVDASNVSDASNKAMDDANTAISSTSSVNGRYDGAGDVCGATKVVDTAKKMITLTFDGSVCLDGKKRSGVITVQLTGSKKWKEAGATIIATFANFKVTNADGSKSIIINGSHSVKNVNGGIAVNMKAGDNPVVHQATSDNMSVTFDDGTMRTWHVSRQITYSFSTLGRSIKIEGTGTNGGVTNAVIWGTNRVGDNFTIANTIPIVASDACGWRKPTAGMQVHLGIAKPITVTFGVDALGTLVSTGCPEFYKIQWTNAQGQPKQAVINY